MADFYVACPVVWFSSITRHAVAIAATRERSQRETSTDSWAGQLKLQKLLSDLLIYWCQLEEFIDGHST